MFKPAPHRARLIKLLTGTCGLLLVAVVGSAKVQAAESSPGERAGAEVANPAGPDSRRNSPAGSPVVLTSQANAISPAGRQSEPPSPASRGLGDAGKVSGKFSGAKQNPDVGSASPVDYLHVDITPPHLDSGDAGTLPGALAVSPSGAANYDIPVIVPPGTAGLQPSLSLNYDSHGTNGLIGVGWSLSGLATINRCGKTIAQDGVNDRVRFSTADRLCMNGQRLVLVNLAQSDENYWSDQAEYRTEIDSFMRIFAVGSAGARSFRVIAKDGQVRTFGSTADSAVQPVVGVAGSDIAPQSGSLAPPPEAKLGQLAWAIDRIVDRSGNYIQFSYRQNPKSGEHLPSAIRYGGNGMPAHAAVEFGFEDRPDAWTRYVDEARTDSRRRLATIKTYVGIDLDGNPAAGTPVRQYNFRYIASKSSGRSLLRSLELCNGESKCMPSTRFDWGQPDANKTMGFVKVSDGWANAPVLTTHHAGRAAHHRDYFAFGDFDKDGYDDVLEKRVASPVPPDINSADGQMREATNPKAPGTLQAAYRYFRNDKGNGFTMHAYRLDSNEHFAVLETADFDGNGLNDILVSTAAGPKVCLSPGSAGMSPASAGSEIIFTCTASIPAFGANETGQLPYVVDIVGDGRSAIYSKVFVDTSTQPFTKKARLCTQSFGACRDVSDPPVEVLGYMNPSDPDIISPIRDHDYFAIDETVDFGGTGKPVDVRWSRPKFLRHELGDPGDRPGGIPRNRWFNLSPVVRAQGFLLPGSAGHSGDVFPYAVAGTFAHPCADASCPPYRFDEPRLGSMSADFNSAGYSSLAFGYLEHTTDTNGAVITRADLMLCLSTGRALDCHVRKKFSGANYLSIRAVGQFVGDGQATILTETLDAQPNRMPTGALNMCSLRGDPSHGSDSAEDSNMVCEPWPGVTLPLSTSAVPIDQVFLMDLMGTGRSQLVIYRTGKFENGAWLENG